MPITYATPEPFAPFISSQYGAAQQFSQDAPAIIRAESDANQFTAANSERADRLRFAYAQANAQAQNDQAERYWRSGAANADREQSAMNLGATLTQRNQESGMEAQARMDYARQGAELQNWMGQQELSQKEVQRLQRMKAAVADVEASNLTPEQKQDAILQLKTGIDPLEQRYKATQAKALEMTMQMKQAELRQMKEAELANQQMEVEAKNRGIGVLKRVDPETGRMQMLFQNPRDGSWYDPWGGKSGSGSGKTEKPPEFKHADNEKEALAEAKGRVGLPPPKPAAGDLSGDSAKAEAEYQRKLDEAFRDIYQRRMRDYQTATSGAPVVTPPQAPQGGATVAPRADVPPTTPAANPPFRAGDVKAMTDYQKQAFAGFQQVYGDIAARKDLPEEKKVEFLEAVEGLVDLQAKYGHLGSPDLTKEDAADRDRFEKKIAAIPAPPAPSAADRRQKAIDMQRKQYEESNVRGRKIADWMRSQLDPITSTSPFNR